MKLLSRNNYVFILSISVLFLQNTYAQIWEIVPGSHNQNGGGISISNCNDKLGVCVGDDNLGSIQSNILLYNGNQFQGIGSTTTGSPYMFYSVRGRTLLAGAHFGISGCGANCGILTEYKNNQWAPLFDVFTNDTLWLGGYIEDMADYDNKTFFGTQNNTHEFNLAYFDDSLNFFSVKDTLRSDATCLSVYRDTLFLGGTFKKTWQHAPSNFFGYLDKSDYRVKPYGDTLNNMLFDLKVYKNELYAVGWFTATNLDSISMIAKMDTITHTWKNVGSKGITTEYQSPTLGWSGAAGFLHEHDHKLFMAGSQTKIDTLQNSNRIAAWDGTRYYSYGAGWMWQIYTVCTFQNLLYASGIDTTGTPFIARLIYDPYTTSIKEETKNYNWDINVFPNPTSDVITLACSSNEEVLYHIYSINGQLIKQDYFTKRTILNTSSFAKGTYKVVVKNRGEIQTISLMVQ